MLTFTVSGTNVLWQLVLAWEPTFRVAFKVPNDAIGGFITCQSLALLLSDIVRIAPGCEPPPYKSPEKSAGVTGLVTGN